MFIIRYTHERPQEIYQGGHNEIKHKKKYIKKSLFLINYKLC
jgi:hypothetical protein